MDDFSQVREIAVREIKEAQSSQSLQAVKTQYLGPKGLLTSFLKDLKSMPLEQKIERGQAINQFKRELEALLDQKHRALEEQARLAQLGQAIDPSLPSPYPSQVPLHPLTQTRNKIIEIFVQLGFSITEGPEIDTEWYCFDALNVTANHPARNEQDTFFFEDDAKVSGVDKKAHERYLLRTQTSTVQIRTLLSHRPPVKVVSPGRVFRRDTVDMTHNFNFHQMEGLWVDKATSLVDLKSTLDHFIHAFFGESYQTRLRPSFFPFTEPSYEMDIFVPSLGKFKNTWLEVLGCGMVHSKVYESVGLDPKEWQGFAFGFGIERLAMLLYGIEDIRRFYHNDERFLKQF